MNKMTLLIFLVMGFCSKPNCSEFEYFFNYGPMIHYNFGAKEGHFSIGFEISFWQDYSVVPIGVDWGLEFEPKVMGEFEPRAILSRIYVELQSGFIGGASAGVVMEQFSNHAPCFGFQGSLWGFAGAGLNLRYRQINQQKFFSPGLFFKIPTKSEGLKRMFV
jgi:hypothetical protein